LKPGLVQFTSVRPGISTVATLKQPGFLEARTTGTLSATTWLLPDPIDDYRTFSTRASVGLERHLGPMVNVGLFYRKGFDFPAPYGDATLPANVFTAQIGYLEWLTTIDARDNVLSPHRGLFAALSLQYAFASTFVLAGDFGDVRVQPELRAYLPLASGVTVAVRATVGLLFARNYSPHTPGRRAASDDDPSTYDHDTTGDTPQWRAFFSGGATSNRGYPTRFVGLRDCAPGEIGDGCSQVIGGATLWEASLELRFAMGAGVSGALFVDSSDVSRDPLDVRLSYPHVAVGPGLRYMTPFGPLRVDFGWRVPGLQRLGGEIDPRELPPEFNFLVRGPFALHFSIGEAF
ncbi:MAG: BamA/TamA family outer membrane protein, partial [Polyangiales bacterium]